MFNEDLPEGQGQLTIVNHSEADNDLEASDASSDHFGLKKQLVEDKLSRRVYQGQF